MKKLLNFINVNYFKSIQWVLFNEFKDIEYLNGLVKFRSKVD